MRKQREQTKINYNFFKTWSHNMAYVFGLWCADGYIYHGDNNAWNWGLTLKLSDMYLLQDVLRVMESAHRIYTRPRECTCRILISNKTIYEDIVALGGVECKSEKLQFPFIPETYLPDYIRGYFDGDGYISPNGRIISILGTKEFIDALHRILMAQNIHITNIKQKHPENGSNCFDLRISTKKNVQLFRDYIYQDNPHMHLIRKKERFI